MLSLLIQDLEVVKLSIADTNPSLLIVSIIKEAPSRGYVICTYE
jgi:hypothetical protein